MKQAIVITGQTATGKTAKALALAHSHGGHIISADARQIYTHLDIITGKDFTEKNFIKVGEFESLTIGYYTIDSIKVWGYDFLLPDQPFSSANYRWAVEHIINNTIDPNVVPIIVGGSYLYIQNLIYGFDISAKPNWDLREKLENSSVEQLQKLVSPATLASMNNSDRNNSRRLIRKIEIQN